MATGVCRIVNMSAKPTKMVRATAWSDDVEEAYRFQLAGYRDAQDYAVCTKAEADRWPHNGYIKKLIRKDGCWYYYNKSRECSDKDVPKCKLYSY
ncbi:meiosis expressed gene 1 protein homolog isoform X1 [Ostrea edulis]|uniref:meiosis expressed gene 1 protein homolog isoform X1 n=2 Tax=Ostrea edulis TaxID=37623 RepID=UPI002094680E|nr:meiosis expressed gene 1 protein homolog isoform X1 [Ostrea edulis]